MDHRVVGLILGDLEWCWTAHVPCVVVSSDGKDMMEKLIVHGS
jgi:hypothetical protein